MKPIDDSDEFDDGLGDGDDDDDAEPEAVAAPVPPPPSPPAAAKNKGGRPRKNPPPQSTHTGVGAAANAPPPKDESNPSTWSKEIMEVWPLLIDWLSKGGAGSPMGPDAIRVNVHRISGIGVVEPMMMGSIYGEAVSGGENFPAADMLRERILDEFHLPTAQGQAKYRCEFAWRQNGKIIKTCEILLPSRDEVRMMRIAQSNLRQQQPQQGFGGAPMPQAPPPWSPPQPQYPPSNPHYQPPQQYGQAPQGWTPPQSQGEQQMRFEMERLREDKARMQGQLDEVMKAFREGRQPNLDSPAQPAAQQNSVVNEVIATLVQFGLIGPKSQSGIGVAAPPVAVAGPSPQVQQPPAAPAADPLAGIESMMASFARLKKVARMVDVMTGDAVEAVAVPEAPEPPDPNAGLGWEAMETGGRFPDGSPIRFAKKKDGTGIDWTGIVFENGYVGERLANMAESTLKPIAEAAQKIMGGMVTVPPAQAPDGEHVAEVVNNVPTNAQHANDYPAT